MRKAPLRHEARLPLDFITQSISETRSVSISNWDITGATFRPMEGRKEKATRKKKDRNFRTRKNEPATPARRRACSRPFNCLKRRGLGAVLERNQNDATEVGR